MTDEDRLSRCDAWLAQGVRDVLGAQTTDQLGSLRYLKAICEIGFFIALRPTAYPLPLVQATCAALESVWASGRLLSVARHNLQHANLFLPLLWACGELLPLNPRQRVDIRRIARLALRYTKERIPFREVDLRYVCMKIDGRRRGFAQVERFAALGCLRLGAAVDCVSALDDYAVTHTVFYMTDFGGLPWPQGASLASSEAVDTILDALRCLPHNSENLDLRGEFLLCRRYLRTPKAFVQHELEQVIGAQNVEGWWAGPVDLSQKLREEAIPSKHWQFMLNYHTTLVCREAVAAWVGYQPSNTGHACARQSSASSVRVRSRQTLAPPNSAEERTAQAFARLLHSASPPIDLALLLEPNVIVDFVDLALYASLHGTLPAECKHALSAYARELTLHIDTNDRVRRIALVLQAATEGCAGLTRWHGRMRDWLACLRPTLFHAPSTDQCYVAALSMWSGALEIEDARSVQSAIQLAVGRCIGVQDACSAAEMAFIGSITGIRCDFTILRSFFHSLCAASLPYGYLDPQAPDSFVHSARLRIASARVALAQRH